MQHGGNDNDEDANLQAALTASAAEQGGTQGFSTGAAAAGQAVGGGNSSSRTGQTLGGAGATSSSPFSGTPSTSRPSSRTGGKVSIRPTPKKTFGTFATLSGNSSGRNSDDEDEDDEKKKPTSWFAGGEKRCVAWESTQEVRFSPTDG